MIGSSSVSGSPRTTPLHLIIKNMTKWYLTRCEDSLPTVVRLVVDAGVDVSVRDEHRCTALYYLLDMV